MKKFLTKKEFKEIKETLEKANTLKKGYIIVDGVKVIVAKESPL